MAKLQEGDVVQLTCGGPKMSVGGPPAKSPDCLWCYWFVEGELKSAAIAEGALVKVERDSAGEQPPGKKRT
jgi:uncharacterized protein YodC (DUF2158 family)